MSITGDCRYCHQSSDGGKINLGHATDDVVSYGSDGIVQLKLDTTFLKIKNE